MISLPHSFYVVIEIYFLIASRISFNKSLAKIKSVSRWLVLFMISDETPCPSL